MIYLIVFFVGAGLGYFAGAFFVTAAVMEERAEEEARRRRYQR